MSYDHKRDSKIRKARYENMKAAVFELLGKRHTNNENRGRIKK